MKPAWEISEAFTRGRLDLSARRNPPPVGWSSLPEYKMAVELKDRGEDDAFVRRATTFLAAMDRARDADALWDRGLRLYEQARWAYDVDRILGTSTADLADALRRSGVSQRHLPDSAAWRRIAEALHARPVRPARRVIDDGIGSAQELIDDLTSQTAGGSDSFPFLGGPKVRAMWVRMMVVPGNASVSGVGAIPVAVDVQVRRVTENLGVADTRAMELEEARGPIQDAWRRRVDLEGVEAPGALAGTSAGLDPALWFFAKWGCSHCEPRGQRVPIHAVCRSCRLPESLTEAVEQIEAAPRPVAPAAGQRPLIGLVGCVASKLDHAAPAKDLYTSPLWRGRRAAVEGAANRWFVLSAKHGLVEPEQWLEPYNVALAHVPREERREWSARVLGALKAKLGNLGEYRFEIHAGHAYFGSGLTDGLRAAGAEVTIPTEGLTQGRQLQFYRGRTSEPPRPAARRGSRYQPVAERLSQSTSPEVRMTFSDLEALIGMALPASARRHVAWWHGSETYAVWKRVGWKATPDLRREQVVFRRRAAAQ